MGIGRNTGEMRRVWAESLDELGVGGEELDIGVERIVWVPLVVEMEGDIRVGACANPVRHGGLEGFGGCEEGVDMRAGGTGQACIQPKARTGSHA